MTQVIWMSGVCSNGTLLEIEDACFTPSGNLLLCLSDKHILVYNVTSYTLIRTWYINTMGTIIRALSETECLFVSQDRRMFIPYKVTRINQETGVSVQVRSMTGVHSIGISDAIIIGVRNHRFIQLWDHDMNSLRYFDTLSHVLHISAIQGDQLLYMNSVTGPMTFNYVTGEMQKHVWQAPDGCILSERDGHLEMTKPNGAKRYAMIGHYSMDTCIWHPNKRTVYFLSSGGVYEWFV